MTNIFSIIAKLYTRKDSAWINEIEDNEIAPVVIQKWLSMNDQVRVQTQWLDKYVFTLPPKMYLSLAWTVIPKSPKAPFSKYIKKEADPTKYDFILTIIRKHFDMSDNDYDANKERIIKSIEQDTGSWFAFYGIEKRIWKKFQLNQEQMKDFTRTRTQQRRLF